MPKHSHRLEEMEKQRKIMIGGWRGLNFTNKLEAMLEGFPKPGVGLEPAIEHKYELIYMLYSVLKVIHQNKMTPDEIFSIFQVVKWNEDKSKQK